MAKEVCKIFQDVDEYFVNNKPDFDKINKIGNYMQDCYNNNPSEPHKCKEDLQGIKVLCSYIFAELHKIPKDIQIRENNDNQYVEYAMMWLGYRLFQTESYSSSTLSNFYNNDLMKSDLFNNYTDLIKKKGHLKDVNLYYMRRLYELFKEACYMTLKYSKNNLDMRKIKNDFKVFQNKYRTLYDKIDECNSYLILLNSIKVAYGHFKRSLITSIPNNKIKELHSTLKDLNPRIKVDKTSTPGFNSRGCKSVNSRAAKKPSRPVSNVPKAKPAESSPHPYQSQSQSQQQKPETPPTKPSGSDKPPPTSSVSPSPQKVLPAAPPPPQIPQPKVQQVPVPAPPAKPESVKPKTEGSSPSESSQQAEQQPALPPVTSTELQLPKLQSTAPSSEPQRAASPETHPPVSGTTTQKGSPDSQGVSNAGAGQLPNQENTSKGSDSGQHNLAGQIKEQGGNTSGKPERPQDGQQENSGGRIGNESSPQSDPSNPSHSSSHLLTSGTNQGNSDDGSVGGSEHANGGSSGSGSDGAGGGSGGGSSGSGSDGAGGGSGGGSSGSGSDGAGGGSGGGSSGSGSDGAEGGKDNGGDAPGSGANDGLSGGSKTPMDQATKHSSGASDGYLSNLWRTRLSPMNYIPSRSCTIY
ncbi:hypothetical protein YYG_04968 [Plasmodium vinckei petteri]|uniref:PIR protein CIR protein n=1 Tax=Plasmodium vinckei petteri TaxID=138298 RepID=W7AEM4_PLAVN|nr:hypothetical protein YYG_04968 [Plasmodium vinckei petteri]